MCAGGDATLGAAGGGTGPGDQAGDERAVPVGVPAVGLPAEVEARAGRPGAVDDGLDPIGEVGHVRDAGVDHRDSDAAAVRSGLVGGVVAADDLAEDGRRTSVGGGTAEDPCLLVGRHVQDPGTVRNSAAARPAPWRRARRRSAVLGHVAAERLDADARHRPADLGRRSRAADAAAPSRRHPGRAGVDGEASAPAAGGAANRWRRSRGRTEGGDGSRCATPPAGLGVPALV